MKTPNRQNKIIINKYNFHSSQKSNKYKSNQSKDIYKRIYDEIELKQNLIQKNTKKIKQIKIDSIKQLIYANQNVPKNWKSKPDYPIQVLEIFSKDSKFLNYLGTGVNTTRPQAISKSTYNLTSNNYFKENNKNNEESSSKNTKNQKLKLTFMKENSRINNLKKYCCTTPTRKKFNKNNLTNEKIMNDKEILNILDELQMNYPIKEKLYELYPEEEIDKIQLKNEMLKNKESKAFKGKFPVINSLKTKNILKNNIYVNLLSSDENEKNNEDIKDERDSKKYLNDYDINILKMRKEMIKSPVATRHLERINYFGPYYSYCPSCGIKNLNFYKKLPLNRLIKLTNIVKKYRIKK